MRIKSLIAAVTALVFSGAAYAGSTPNWAFGYIPTPAEWNTWWGKKLDDPGCSGYGQFNGAGAPSCLASIPASALSGTISPSLLPAVALVAPLTVTAVNTLSALPLAYNGTFAELIVNGVAYTAQDTSPAFSVIGTAITWNATNAGFSLQTTDKVTAIYQAATPGFTGFSYTPLNPANNLNDLSNTTTARNNLIPSGTITGAQMASGAAAANLSAALGFTTMPSSTSGAAGSNLTVYGAPYGSGNGASTLCVQAFLGNGYPCPVNGNIAAYPNTWALYPTGRGFTNIAEHAHGASSLFSGAVSVNSTIGTLTPASYTRGSFTLSLALSAPQIAALKTNEYVTSSDGCRANINNWLTSGLTVYVNDWQACPASATQPGAGATVTVYNDPSQLAGTFSGGKFTFTTALNADQRNSLKIGMSLDTGDKCSGSLGSWDATAGTWVQVDANGFFTQPSGAACTPTAPNTVIISEQIKQWGYYGFNDLGPMSRAQQSSNEIDCVNNQAYNVSNTAGIANVSNQIWCWDVVNLGSHQSQYGIDVRGITNLEPSFYDGFAALATFSNAAFEAVSNVGGAIPVAFQSNGSGIGYAFRDVDGGQIWAQLQASAGKLSLGPMGATTGSPAIKFYSSGSRAVFTDAQISVTGGGGSANQGALTMNAATVNISGNLNVAPVAIASLPACASGTVATIAWVNNGIASPTYHQAVSTTGTAVWPVFCTYNGTSYGWVY